MQAEGRQAEKAVRFLEDILLASVEENGGARNISGLYGISDDLAHVLKSWLTDGKIVPEIPD